MDGGIVSPFYYMKRLLLLTGITGMMLFTGCARKPKEVPLPWTAPPPVNPVSFYTIIDYKTQKEGGKIPEWVAGYDRDGLLGIETLPEYQDNYMFMGTNRGTNFKTLTQWASGFRVSHDFARMVSARIQDRLTAGASTYPDYEYGAFFEAAVKASSDAEYPGAVQAADFWLKKQYFQEDGLTPDQEGYEFFILVGIDKATLKTQIDAILKDAEAAATPTKAQAAAINRVKANFYEGF